MRPGAAQRSLLSRDALLLLTRSGKVYFQHHSTAGRRSSPLGPRRGRRGPSSVLTVGSGLVAKVSPVSPIKFTVPKDASFRPITMLQGSPLRFTEQ